MHNASGPVQSVALETYGGLITLARPENVPEGASPRNYDVDFPVGSVETRPPLENTVSFQNAVSGPNGGAAAVDVATTGNAWTNPANVLASDGSFAVCTPGSGSDGLAVSAFSFNLPPTVQPTGLTVSVKGWATAPMTLTAQILLAGVPSGVAKSVFLPTTNGVVNLGGATDLWGLAAGFAAVNNTGFGVLLTASTAFPVAQALLDYVSIAVGETTAGANFNFVTTFVAQDGTVKNLSLDAGGNFWVEDVTNLPGVLALAFNGVKPGCYAKGANGPDVEYLAFNDLTAGCDVPRQYTPNWTDRISQVGPGAPPVFAATSASATNYPIATITQPPAGPFAGGAFAFGFGLQSAGPGTTTAGNVVTMYYSDSTTASQDADLVAAFNSGQPVYLFVQMQGQGSPLSTPITVLVTSIGLGYPPGQARQFYYFTYSAVSVGSVYSTGQAGFRVQYQRTLATMTTTVPVPQLTVGSRAVVTGDSVPAWNATWPIAQTLNSGAMAITQSSLTAGVATYSYAVVSGQNPVAGELVTITGTLNANGTLNVVNVAIASVSGTNLGTFTVGGFSAAVDYVAQAESGQATTDGTMFAFDPGVLTLGTATSPIYGTGTGGAITVTGTGLFMSAGTKQGVCFFITRNGYWTAPSPPVTFTIPNNTTGLNYSMLPIGPPNTIARGIALTESGANNVPGGNFFTLPTPVQFIVQGTRYTATSLIVNDNTTTSGTLFVQDAELLNATAIDVQGQNLFNQIELGNPGWVVQYNSRNFYGLCQNKIQNFNNLSFDGGYLPGAQLTPLGWTVPDMFGKLLVSPVFGNSYYIRNSSGSVLPVAGLISQGAYQDAYLQPILYPNTAYSVRVTARGPSGSLVGNLVVDLTAAGIVYGSFAYPLAALTSSMTTVTGTLLTQEFATVPPGLLLRVYAAALANLGDVEIDRVEIFPTAIPVLSTTVFGSYAGKLEAVDGVTGQVGFTSENQEPVNGAVVMYDTLYCLKGQSLYSLSSSGGLEPAQWSEPEVAQRVGACGPNAYDFGEQWIVTACRNGLYLFDGGQPGKIMQEVYQIWDAIHWAAGNSIWVRNDVPGRRLYVGIPLPTPNFWLPNAPVNAAPTVPNVMLMLNYQGCDSGEAVKQEIQLHTTMFGTLNATDMKRKWSIWQIASPYAASVSTSGQVTGQKDILDAEMRFCNGIGSSKIYRLNRNLPANQIPTDDGAPIQSLYTTYGHTNASKAAQMPLLGVFRKLWSYMTHQARGVGLLTVRLLPNTLVGPADSSTGYYPWTLPGGFTLTDPCTQDREAPLNFAATRTFVEFSTTGRMNLSNLVMTGRKHVMNALTGQR